MERLSMSLDDIIAKKGQDSKGKRNNRPQQSRAVKSTQQQNTGRKFQQNSNYNNRIVVTKNSENNRPKFLHRESTQPATAANQNRSLKIVTLERPKIVIKPTTTENPPVKAVKAAPTVFTRLGTPGTPVLFSNLAHSVEEADIRELSRVVGEIRETKLSIDARGVRTVQVTFANEQEANLAVAKYHGVPLDGQVMIVTIDASKQVVKTVFDRIQPVAHATTNVTSTEQLRGGLFGSALQTSTVTYQDDDEGLEEEAVEEDDEEQEDEGEEEVEQQQFVRRIIVPNGNRRGPVNGRGGNAHRGNNPRRGGGSGGRGGRASNKKDVDLDADLDSYFAAR